MSGVDRISVLSDAILLRILSFLPSKTVVATSILSRRWRDLWHSVPTVDLDDSSFSENEDDFVDFAYAVMLLRDRTKPILNFRLKIFHASCDVNLWLKIAMQREVETIDLSFFCYSPMKLPAAIFTCSSLVVLKLMNVTVDRTSTVHLPLLKTLHMDRVRFAAKAEYLEIILSGCPNIHHLQIKGLDLQPSFIPLAVTFTNLIHMELFVSQFNWFWIVGLLNSCPFLQVLDVGGEKSARPSGIPDQPFPQPVPECISSHLRTCTIRNFDGIDVSIQFVAYILQNAMVLNILNIYCRRSIEGDRCQI